MKERIKIVTLQTENKIDIKKVTFGKMKSYIIDGKRVLVSKKMDNVIIILSNDNFDFSLIQEIISYYLLKWRIIRRRQPINKRRVGYCIYIIYELNKQDEETIKKLLKYNCYLSYKMDSYNYFSVPIIINNNNIIYQKLYKSNYLYESYYNNKLIRFIKNNIINNKKINEHKETDITHIQMISENTDVICKYNYEIYDNKKNNINIFVYMTLTLATIVVLILLITKVSKAFYMLLPIIFIIYVFMYLQLKLQNKDRFEGNQNNYKKRIVFIEKEYSCFIKEIRKILLAKGYVCTGLNYKKNRINYCFEKINETEIKKGEIYIFFIKKDEFKIINKENVLNIIFTEKNNTISYLTKNKKLDEEFKSIIREYFKDLEETDFN